MDKPLPGITAERVPTSRLTVNVISVAGRSTQGPAVLFVHGTDDPRVPLQSMTKAETALRAAGVPVETLACVGTQHSIDQDGLCAAPLPAPSA